jgi:hypothetical protein
MCHITIACVSSIILHCSRAENIYRICRKPSDIDPSGKDPTPTGTETDPSVETGPTARDRSSEDQPTSVNTQASNELPTGNQSAEANVNAEQEPPTRNQLGTTQDEDIPEAEAQAGSPPKKDANADPGSKSPVKVQGPSRP